MFGDDFLWEILKTAYFATYFATYACFSALGVRKKGKQCFGMPNNFVGTLEIFAKISDWIV